MANSLDTIGIMKIIPHRHPFLLIDKVEDYVPGEYAIAYKKVPSVARVSMPFGAGNER